MANEVCFVPIIRVLALLVKIIQFLHSARVKLDLSTKGALEALKRGWFREAVIKLFTKTGKAFYVQCTT